MSEKTVLYRKLLKKGLTKKYLDWAIERGCPIWWGGKPEWLKCGPVEFVGGKGFCSAEGGFGRTAWVRYLLAHSGLPSDWHLFLKDGDLVKAVGLEDPVRVGDPRTESPEVLLSDEMNTLQTSFPCIWTEGIGWLSVSEIQLIGRDAELPLEFHGKEPAASEIGDGQENWEHPALASESQLAESLHLAASESDPYVLHRQRYSLLETHPIRPQDRMPYADVRDHKPISTISHLEHYRPQRDIVITCDAYSISGNGEPD